MKSFCIYGPPGTGKTTDLVRLTGAYIEKGIEPNRILFLSHTKAAATEAASRISSGINAKTTHSLAFQMKGIVKQQVVDYVKLKDFSKEVGIPVTGKSPDSDQQLGLGDELLAIYNLSLSKKEAPMETYEKSSHPTSKSEFVYFYESYVNWKSTHGFIDFTDMLVNYINDPIDIKIDLLIVDEAQDLSPLQWSMIDELAKFVKFIVIAGDDDQSIFAWGGADPEGMPKFQSKYNATIKFLTQSYRVPRKIHELATSIISNVENRVEKIYLPRDTEGKIKHYGDICHFNFNHFKDKDVMLLFRNYAMRKEVEQELLLRAVPYVCDSGPKGHYDNKYGKALKIWDKILRDEHITGRDNTFVKSMLCSESYKSKFHSDIKKLFDIPPTKLFSTPFFVESYYKRVDLSAKNPIILSSIHGSKGREADIIVLHSGMTQRTIEGMIDDPCSEHRVFYVAVTRAKKELHIISGDSGYVI